MKIIAKQNWSSCEGGPRRMAGEVFRCDERMCERVRTCNEQRVHARRSLRGLEHFGDVLLGQRGLASALALGVLLLPPLEVLGREKQKKTSENRRGRTNIPPAGREKSKETAIVGEK